MIDKTNALAVFQVNIARTNSLITAMEKIKAYNWLYQQDEAKRDALFVKTVTDVQNVELQAIELACAEHAIISLATAFETYYRELVQEILATKPDFFLRQSTTFSNHLDPMLQDKFLYTYEEVEDKLNMRARSKYKKFFKEYNLPFITDDNEKNLIDYIYVQRNYFVHNASRQDSRRDEDLSKIAGPVKELVLTTEAKRLRTSVSRLIPKIDRRVKESITS